LRKLPADDPDTVLLRAYAWCAAYAEVHGAFALVSKNTTDLAREIAAGLGRKADGDDERSFNSTKLSAWKDWMAFLGLGWNDLPGTTGFLPDASRRIEEELSTLIPTDSRVDVRSFLAAIAKALPYLDGGALFDQACKEVLTSPPAGQLSRLLSHALRALNANAFIRCGMEGDARDGVGFFPDPVSEVQAFSYVERLSGSRHV
jgi:hypothetical protein